MFTSILSFKRFALLSFIAALSLGLVACEENEATPILEPTLAVQSYSNLDARGDVTMRDPVTGVVTLIEARPRTYFNLRTGQLRVAATDSNSTSWDMAFESTGIYINGGVSGPGAGGAVVLNDLFDNVITAPDDGAFRLDAAGGGANLAIAAQGNTMPPNPLGWYTFSTIPGGMGASLITPTPGRTIVIRCANGQFAKVRILSYYQNAPDPATVTVTTPSRYYTFEWSVAPAGSRSLK
jgi:HmuY protein